MWANTKEQPVRRNLSTWIFDKIETASFHESYTKRPVIQPRNVRELMSMRAHPNQWEMWDRRKQEINSSPVCPPHKDCSEIYSCKCCLCYQPWRASCVLAKLVLLSNTPLCISAASFPTSLPSFPHFCFSRMTPPPNKVSFLPKSKRAGPRKSGPKKSNTQDGIWRAEFASCLEIIRSHLWKLMW